ncbi:hypothetical protein [Desulfitobacterium hafniense]|uniref:hypothetical protein n=1 Tax=Desulfitobacterium hafniense TaxID=49338 RepID=UPI000371E910|nr:hypothetical protein [Desulfitobacterium hafniense]
MKKEQNIRVTVKTVPHPNPQSAIDLIAEIIVNQLLKSKSEESGVDEPSAAAN